MNRYELISRDEYLAHHGIKGQKWGIRRYQNEDGSLTSAGERRYHGANGEEKRKKDIARDAYRKAVRDTNRRYGEAAQKYEKKRVETLYSLDGGSVKDRAKRHLKNEYKLSKEMNKIDQQRLNAKRAYREQIGKKKVDTFMMKLEQKRINEVANQSESEFVKEYISSIANRAVQSITNRDYD